MKLSDLSRSLEVLTAAWDTSGGLALRKLLWSLHGARMGRDGGMLEVQLWDAIGSMDEVLRLEFACLVTQTLEARISLCAELLKASGEWDRIDDHPLVAD